MDLFFQEIYRCALQQFLSTSQSIHSLVGIFLFFTIFDLGSKNDSQVLLCTYFPPLNPLSYEADGCD